LPVGINNCKFVDPTPARESVADENARSVTAPECANYYYRQPKLGSEAGKASVSAQVIAQLQ
jgi:hypothetical protein